MRPLLLVVFAVLGIAVIGTSFAYQMARRAEVEMQRAAGDRGLEDLQQINTELEKANAAYQNQIREYEKRIAAVTATGKNADAVGLASIAELEEYRGALETRIRFESLLES